MSGVSLGVKSFKALVLLGDYHLLLVCLIKCFLFMLS